MNLATKNMPVSEKDDCIADRGIASVNGSKVELRYRDCAYGKEET